MSFLKIEDESWVEVYEGADAGWKLCMPNKVHTLEAGRCFLLRTRASVDNGLSDEDCPEIETYYSQYLHPRRTLKRRKSVDLVSPLKKSPKRSENHTSSAEIRAPNETQSLLVKIEPTEAGSHKPQTKRHGGEAENGVIEGQIDLLQGERGEGKKESVSKKLKNKAYKADKGSWTMLGRHRVRVFKPLHYSLGPDKPHYPYDFAAADYVAGHDEIARLKYIDSRALTQMKTFSLVFSGAPYRRTTLAKYSKIWKSAPDDLRRRYLDAGSQSSAGHFAAFLGDLKRSGDSEGEEYSEDAGSESDGSSTSTASNSLNNEGLVPVEFDPEKALGDDLCPFCDTPLPSPLSPTLSKELEQLKAKSRPSASELNRQHRIGPGGIHFFMAFCSRHEAEAAAALTAAWPKVVDFVGLPNRVRRLLGPLDAIVKNPHSSSFYHTAITSFGPSSSSGTGGRAMQTYGKQGAA